jgi:hypothetical protein
MKGTFLLIPLEKGIKGVVKTEMEEENKEQPLRPFIKGISAILCFARIRWYPWVEISLPERRNQDNFEL